MKKIIRDDHGIVTDEKRDEVLKELGDVLWYISQLSSELELSLDDIASENITKLMSRKKRSKIRGSGDNR